MKRGTWRAAGGIAGIVLGCVLAAPASEEVIRCRMELDRGVLPAGAAQRAVLKLTLGGVESARRRERPPVNLAVVLDKSGSMQGEKVARAREAAIEALGRLDARDVFSLVAYDSNVQTLVPAQSAGNTAAIEERIRSIGADGSTALFGGVSQAAAELRRNLEPRYVHRILLLSDGLANVGPSTPEDLGRLGTALIKEGISVTTVGVGTDYNEDLMARLSQNSDGNTYFVRQSSDLARIFKEELGDVLSVVATKVKIVIECPEGVQPLSVIGREGRIRGRTVELTLNQLYGGQEKYVLVEVQVPAGRHGEEREMAKARVDYFDAFNGGAAQSSARASVSFSEDNGRVVASVNGKVMTAYELNGNALIQNEAIELADQGRVKEAAKKLAESAEKLKNAGWKYEDKELLDRAEQMEEQAARLEKEGMTSESRKGMRADSYQIWNQQRAR